MSNPPCSRTSSTQITRSGADPLALSASMWRAKMDIPCSVNLVRQYRAELGVTPTARATSVVVNRSE